MSVAVAFRSLLPTVVVLVTLAAVLVAVLWVFQRRLIYYPPAAPPPPAAEVLPGAEDVTLRTDDGLSLGAWFVPSQPDGGRQGTAPPAVPGPAVLVANGNAGDRAARAPLAQALAREGLAVLLFDYRGYAGNPGTPSEDGLIADARAAADHLAGREEVDPKRIVYYGESLGSGVVAALAAERPPAATVLRSPFPSLAEVGARHYPFLPVRALLRDRYPAAKHLATVDRPLLVIAGEGDRLVPPELSRELYEAAGEPKRMVIVPAADHNDLALLAGDRLLGELTAFLEQQVGLWGTAPG